MSKEYYFDIDGNPVPLEELCRTDPDWAAHTIRTLKIQRDVLYVSEDLRKHTRYTSNQTLNIMVTMWADELKSDALAIRAGADCKDLVEVKADSLLRLALNMKETAKAGMGEGDVS